VYISYWEYLVFSRAHRNIIKVVFRLVRFQISKVRISEALYVMH